MNIGRFWQKCQLPKAAGYRIDRILLLLDFHCQRKHEIVPLSGRPAGRLATLGGYKCRLMQVSANTALVD